MDDWGSRRAARLIFLNTHSEIESIRQTFFVGAVFDKMRHFFANVAASTLRIDSIRIVRTGPAQMAGIPADEALCKLCSSLVFLRRVPQLSPIARSTKVATCCFGFGQFHSECPASPQLKHFPSAFESRPVFFFSRQSSTTWPLWRQRKQN